MLASRARSESLACGRMEEEEKEGWVAEEGEVKKGQENQGSECAVKEKQKKGSKSAKRSVIGGFPSVTSCTSQAAYLLVRFWPL